MKDTCPKCDNRVPAMTACFESDELELNHYCSFRNVVSIILNNWNALKYAVEHGLAGPPTHALRKLSYVVDTIWQILHSDYVDGVILSDLLDYIMRTLFCTVVEDGSCQGISIYLCSLYHIFAVGDLNQVRSFIDKMAVKTPIHIDPPMQKAQYYSQAGAPKEEVIKEEVIKEEVIKEEIIKDEPPADGLDSQE